VPVLARQAGALAGDADLLDALSALVDTEDAASLAAAPESVARRSVRAWLLGDGDHPPSLDAVERVLDVARMERRAAELPGGRRVARSRGRLSLGPATGAAAEGSGSVPGDSPVQSRRGHR